MKRWKVVTLAFGIGFLSAAVAAEELSGAVDWARRVELSTPLSGRIAKVEVAPGQRVKQGELLVELDPRVWQAQLGEAKAALRKAKVDADEAERELARTQEMFDRTMLSEHERQLGEIAAERARANLSDAKAKLVQAETDVEYSRITAPFDGVAVEVAALPQQVVVNRFSVTPLVVVADPARMKVTVPVAADRAAQLQPGSEVKVDVRGQGFVGKVSWVGLEPVAKGGEAAWPAEILFDVPQGRMVRPGERALVSFDR